MGFSQIFLVFLYHPLPPPRLPRPKTSLAFESFAVAVACDDAQGWAGEAKVMRCAQPGEKKIVGLAIGIITVA